ncbi:MAG: HAD hydrolase-like protein [Desulfobacterales bacterium]|jgi:phosphoglycolate phosphatase-like HAD superfamily hydrolase
MNKKCLIVFDMDGVLIDVSNSYRAAARQTARLFYKSAPASEKLPEPLFPLRDLAAVKQSGGLNNDWDLSCLVISLLFNLIEKPPVYQSKDPWARYQETIRQCDVSSLASFLESTPMPLSNLLQRAGKTKNSFIYGLFAGDVGSGNIIKQIFQEVYLGKDLFEATYGLNPLFYHAEGFIHREKPLIARDVLEALARNHILAIATGRPRAEVEYPLAHFDLKKYFTNVLALEDCLEEEKRRSQTEGNQVSLSKPDPFMLDAIAAKQKNPLDGYFYIGDMPDDMVAAKKSAAGYKAVGIIMAAADKQSLKKELLRAGADYIIEDFDQLKSLLKSRM